MPSAFIIGGTGQIGIAVARRLAREGWSIRLASRTPPPVEGPWQHVPFDHGKPEALAAAIGSGADLLMDCIAFDEADADKLLSVQASVGHIIAVSSVSVYRDERGRTLDEASECGFPCFPVPIRENQPTVEPSPKTYSTRKVAMEMRLLDRAGGRATILRPAAIHGPFSKHAREWWFVRRLLDGRQRIPLAYGGRSRFQTTSGAAIAETVTWVIEGDRPPILNVADADAPTAAEIGNAIMATMAQYAEIVGLSAEPYPPSIGMSPWSVERPLVCSSLAPNAGTYAATVPDPVLWLLKATRNRDWRTVLPQLAAYPWEQFDYEREDQVLSAL
jgi:nucleoside-diphosphate-sugar epimerase